MRPLFALLLLLPLLAAAESVRSVPLKNRSAEEVAAVLRPVAPPGVGVAAEGGRLLLRGKENEVADLARLAAQLDVAQKQLRITVRRGADAERNSEGAEARGTAAGPEVRVYGTRSRSEPESRQQLQVMEGQWARIESGKSVPVVRQSTTVGPHGATVQHGTEYKEVQSGFEVLPRLNGEVVTLEVRAFRGDLAREGGGVIEHARAESTVQGKLGQWIELAGSVESSRRDEQGTVYATRARDRQQQRIQIKVELVP